MQKILQKRDRFQCSRLADRVISQIPSDRDRMKHRHVHIPSGLAIADGCFQFYNNPELFWHNYQPIDIKKNQLTSIDIIKTAIKEAILKVIDFVPVIKFLDLDDEQ